MTAPARLSDADWLALRGFRLEPDGRLAELAPRQAQRARRERAAAELQADPARSNRAIATAAGVCHHTARAVRLELEAAGQIPAWRSSRTPWSGHAAAAEELQAGPARPNRTIAALAGVGPGTVRAVRLELETSGRIPAWRGRSAPAAIPAAGPVPGASSAAVRALCASVSGVG